MKEAKISNYVLIGLSAISIIVLIAFMGVGFDTPFEDNPSFKAPQLTDLLMCWTYGLIVITLVLSVWSIIMQITKGKSSLSEPGLAGKTDIIAVGILILSIVIGAVYGAMDTEMLNINNKAWNPADEENATSNMITVISMVSVLILSAITILATIASMIAGMLKK